YLDDMVSQAGDLDLLYRTKTVGSIHLICNVPGTMVSIYATFKNPDIRMTLSFSFLSILLILL
ncbi:MAG: hypothetical protein MJK07_20615, partial [Flavobacteriales bacterium]|nr:hypothetical protein [Flavobacteriales bacterium]